MTVLSTAILSAENAKSIAIDSTNTRLKQNDEIIFQKYIDIFTLIDTAARDGQYTITHDSLVSESDTQELIGLLEKYGYQVSSDQTQLTVSWS